MIRFRAFRAIDEPDSCKKYIDGHIKVLADYGITNITSNNQEWMFNENIFVIIAENIETNELIGGIRVQVSDGILPLPVETAIGHIDDRIYDIIKSYRLEGVGELCALWNGKAVAGIGLSVLLTRAGISIINQLKFRTLVGICADYTLKMFTQVGFVVDRTLGINGEFNYPNDNYKAKVLGIMNAKSLESASKVDRDSMIDLRINPIQKRLESGPKGEIMIDYNLVIKTDKFTGI